MPGCWGLYLVLAAVSNAGLTTCDLHQSGTDLSPSRTRWRWNIRQSKQQLFIGRNAILNRSLFRLSEWNFLKQT